MMKSILKLPFFLLLLAMSHLYASELDWNHDYEKALSLAQKDHKLIYLFIGADRCRFCDKFKEISASKKEFAERMKKNFILLYMSRDRDPVPKKFEKYGVPRHYFLTSDGKIIYTEQGVWDLSGWFSLIDDILEEYY